MGLDAVSCSCYGTGKKLRMKLTDTDETLSGDCVVNIVNSSMT